MRAIKSWALINGLTKKLWLIDICQVSDLSGLTCVCVFMAWWNENPDQWGDRSSKAPFALCRVTLAIDQVQRATWNMWTLDYSRQNAFIRELVFAWLYVCWRLETKAGRHPTVTKKEARSWRVGKQQRFKEEDKQRRIDRKRWQSGYG